MAPPQVDAEYKKEIENARRDLRDLISSKKCAPQMLHLALHDAGAYNPHKKITVGPNGSTRKEAEKVDFNERLKEAVKLCEDLKKEKNYNKITYADLYQLAGVVALEVTKGPIIQFITLGRADSEEDQELERLIPLSEIDKNKLKDIIIHIGVNHREFVALCGGLYGLVSKQGTDGLKFDNSYFRDLAAKHEKKEQTRDEDAVKYPAEKALREEDFIDIVKIYEKDENRFLADYVAAHKKLLELGHPPVPAKSTGTAEPAFSGMSDRARSTGTAEPASSGLFGSWNRRVLAQGALGIALATTVVILGYFWSRRSK